MRSAQFLALIASCALPVQFVAAQVTVEVSSTYSAIQFAHHGALATRQIVTSDILPTPNDDVYILKIRPQGSTRVFVIDGRDIASNNPSPRFLLDRTISGPEEIRMPDLPKPLGLAVVIQNLSATPKETAITIFRIGSRPNSAIDSVKNWIEIPIRALDLGYVMPKFKVTVKPCGTVNAYSSPDVTICTELMAQLADRGLSEALYPVLLHEIGHSLLYLWQLPGYDNEDVVDEFAAAFLARAFPRALDAYIEWLESHDSLSQSVAQLAAGSRHTISIQRARNMKSVLSNREDVLNRWAHLLSPYQRKRPQGKLGSE